MAGISYIQVEQGVKILALESALEEQKQTVAELREHVKLLEGFKSQASRTEREKERQRLDLLAAQRAAQLAENALDKSRREIPALKTKLAESDKERKALKSLNPEKMKRNLVEQKRKTEEAKTAVVEWKQRTKKSRDEHKAEVKDLQKTMLKILEERDAFAEISGYRLALSRFRFSSESPDQKTQMRIRVTNMETSESAVVFDVSEKGDVKILSNMKIPMDVVDRIKIEWISIRETGTVTKESSETFEEGQSLS